MCQEKIGVIYSRDLRKFKAILWISKCNFLVVRRTCFVPCGCCAEHFLGVPSRFIWQGEKDWSWILRQFSRTKAYSLKRGNETSSSSFSGSSVVHEEINQRKLINKCFEQFSVLLLGIHNTVDRTSLIRRPKGQSEVSVLERYPCKRGHYDDVTFTTIFTGLSFK